MAATPALVALSGPAAWPLRRPWAVAERRAVLVIGDLIVVAGAMLLTQRVAGSLVDSGQGLVWVAVLWLVWFAVARALNTYGSLAVSNVGGALQRLTATAVITLLVYVFVPYWSPPLPAGRWLFGLNGALLFCGLLAWRTTCALVLARPAFRTRVLLLGRGQLTNSVRQMLFNLARHDYDLVGVLDVGDRQRTPPIGTDELIAYVEQTGVRELVVDPSVVYPAAIQAALVELGARGVAVTSVLDLYEALTGRSPLPNSTVSWAPGRQVSAMYGFLRRAFDVAVATVGIVLFLPLLVALSLLVRLDSPGHALFWQERVGRHGRPFRMLKLRTMRLHAETIGRPVWARQRDPRVTRVGTLLRRSRLDEVPQLWNVLRGDMSLIGPRPERPEFAAVLTRRIPLYRARHAIRPGITGWAQVQLGYTASVRDATTKLQYDLYYIRHCSPVLDATILLKTLLVVLRLKGM